MWAAPSKKKTCSDVSAYREKESMLRLRRDKSVEGGRLSKGAPKSRWLVST
jgi:hypothetical protein